jgi:hypothetical protein
MREDGRTSAFPKPGRVDGPKKRRHQPACRDCGDLRYDGEPFFRGLCDTCRHKRAVARRAQTGARAIANAKPAGTLERDGQQFRVVVLPPKRRGGSRIR